MSDDELLDKLLVDFEAGRQPDRDELLAQHPHLAEQLTTFFASHDRMRRIVTPLREAQDEGEETATWTGGDRDTDDGSEEAPKVPGYEIIKQLGKGGMGVVWLARETDLDRLVAIKMVTGGTEADTVRFLREAKAVAALQHPNIVEIFRFGEADGRPFLVLEYLDGGSLADRLRGDGPMSAAEAARMLAPLARAIARAHDKGILHRDLKPQNVLLGTDGTTKVTDFGLAKWRADDGAITAPGSVMGTPFYMSPQQARGVELDDRTDIYSLGVILYECVSGRPPFVGATTFEVLRQVVEEPPAYAVPVKSAADRAVRAICLRCLAKHPKDRYASATELAEALETVAAPAEGRSRPPWGVAVAVVVGLIVAVAAWAWWPSGDSPSPQPPPPEERPFYTRTDTLGVIAADRAEHPERRYLTLSHLINDPAFSEEDLESLRDLLGRVSPTLRPVDEAGSVYAFEPAEAGIGDWPTLISGDPYALEFETAEIPPMTRADWLVRKLADRGSVNVDGIAEWAERFSGRPVDLTTAAAELGVADEGRIADVIRGDQDRLAGRFGLAPLLDGGEVSRPAWESRKLGTSPYQELAGLLGVGVPAYVE